MFIKDFGMRPTDRELKIFKKSPEEELDLEKPLTKKGPTLKRNMLLESIKSEQKQKI